MKGKLLIVEDEKDICDMLAEQLETDDIQVDKSYDAENAIEKIKVNEYDLVLTDIRLPGMDGTQMIEKIKSEMKDYPIFFVMTGFSDYSEEDIKKKGASSFFSKPQDLTELITDIHQFFNQKARRGKVV